ncbi:MAG: AAA family ATPase [Candidatus Levybacteria bacterium]|nr:AAA family ATPase [Candidatus Levybacteria bacterium]
MNSNELILPQVTINGLPRSLHEGKTLQLRHINYFFGPNGSGKSLSLRKVAEHAKAEIRNKNLDKTGFFAQYITATPQHNFYQQHYQLLDRDAATFDLESADITGQGFYQHLQDYPEIGIKVRDALQKYLGRYPNVARKGINLVMNFFREDELDVPGYSPEVESDGLKRLSLLLGYIYHPKCKFLAIDEPELYLHPDMISFLLQEVLNEVQFGKQFVFATHSPEMIRIGEGKIYTYSYFNLKNTLAETHIIQAHESNAIKIIEGLGYLLDVNRRAFLYAPVTLFVEGIADEVVYNHLKEKGLVDWSRRIFVANVGGANNMFNFWKLWRLFDKEVRVILDNPTNSDANASVNVAIGEFCDDLNIDKNLTLEQKREKLAEHNVFVAPFVDVLVFKDKTIELKDFEGASPQLDFTDHIGVLNKALEMQESSKKQIRSEEKEWMISLAKEVFGDILDTSSTDKQSLISEAKQRISDEHPNITIQDDPSGEFLMTIRFEVSKGRVLYLHLADEMTDSKVGLE